MVKVKIIDVEVEWGKPYIGGIYEAFKIVRTNGSCNYYVNVASDTILNLNQRDCEEIEEARPTLGAAHEPDLRTITMENIITDLGINIGDIVCVYTKGSTYHLKCNEKYDLVELDNSYQKYVPNLILGMVNGKYAYEVYSCKYGFAIEKPNQQIN